MQLICLGLATAITLLALITHVTIGTKQNAAPILDDETLPADPRHTLTFSWKANSILMLFMSVSFGMAFVDGIGALVLYNALLALALAGTAAYVAMRSGLNPFKFPPMPLFSCIGALALASYCL